MVGNNHQYNLSTTQDFDFNYTRLANPTVCAKTGVAGIGSSTDHGLRKATGGRKATRPQSRPRWHICLYDCFHDAKSGYSIEEFPSRPLRVQRHRIIFRKVVGYFNHAMDFKKQIECAQNFPHAQVEAYTFKELSLQEQNRRSRRLHRVTLCGGGM
jgi:hypothetical protein